MSISNGVPATAANLNAAFVSLSAENTFPEEQTYEKGLLVKEIATPATPASGYLAVYAKTDGEAYVKNDAGTETKISNIIGVGSNSYLLENFGLAASVAANALTVAFKTKALSDASASDIATMSFRSATAASGTFVSRTLAAASSIVISSGSTLGHVSAANEIIYVYALDNAGTIEPAISSSLYDEGSIVTTTVLAGGGGDDSRTAIYSTVARSNVAIRLVARLKSTQATAGTWATAISEITLAPLKSFPTSEIWLSAGNGHGSTNNKIRRYTTTDKNIGSDMTYADSAGNGMSITINTPGIYSFSYTDYKSSGVATFGITLNGTALTTAIESNSRAQGFVVATNSASGSINTVSVALTLKAGDIIRAHTDGTVNGSTLILSNFIAARVA